MIYRNAFIFITLFGSVLAGYYWGERPLQQETEKDSVAALLPQLKTKEIVKIHLDAITMIKKGKKWVSAEEGFPVSPFFVEELIEHWEGLRIQQQVEHLPEEFLYQEDSPKKERPVPVSFEFSDSTTASFLVGTPNEITGNILVRQLGKLPRQFFVESTVFFEGVFSSEQDERVKRAKYLRELMAMPKQAFRDQRVFAFKFRQKIEVELDTKTQRPFLIGWQAVEDVTDLKTIPTPYSGVEYRKKSFEQLIDYAERFSFEESMEKDLARRLYQLQESAQMTFHLPSGPRSYTWYSNVAADFVSDSARPDVLLKLKKNQASPLLSLNYQDFWNKSLRASSLPELIQLSFAGQSQSFIRQGEEWGPQGGEDEWLRPAIRSMINDIFFRGAKANFLQKQSYWEGANELLGVEVQGRWFDFYLMQAEIIVRPRDVDFGYIYSNSWGLGPSLPSLTLKAEKVSLL